MGDILRRNYLSIIRIKTGNSAHVFLPEIFIMLAIINPHAQGLDAEYINKLITTFGRRKIHILKLITKQALTAYLRVPKN